MPSTKSRIKMNNSKQTLKKLGHHEDQGPSNRKSPSSSNNQKQLTNFPIPLDNYLYCKKTWHYKRQYPVFLKYLLENGKYQVTFVVESLI